MILRRSELINHALSKYSSLLELSVYSILIKIHLFGYRYRVW